MPVLFYYYIFLDSHSGNYKNQKVTLLYTCLCLLIGSMILVSMHTYTQTKINLLH